ncbi:MAG: 8-amino-7-oxononanoate synthase [Desulfobacterota bacterium]|nr:8-amino-7-oxononanoate synthase [Thermodesulfobacteriota bacterium]
MIDTAHEMEELQRLGRLRTLRQIASAPGPTVVVEGKTYLMFSSNDYLGLAAHPSMIKAAAAAAAKWGVGAGASRLVSGTMLLHEELERDIAWFKQTEAALLFGCGYMANIGILSALAGPGDDIFSDELNHASIIDGCRLSRARTVVYPHCDIHALEGMLASSQGRRRIIVTDGVFSMDGDIAPVPDLLKLARRFDAVLLLDDAHATGTIGKNGKGTLEHFGIGHCPDNVMIMGTLGKALGCFGAFFAGTVSLRTYLINHARSFIFTTALPPPVVAAAREALHFLIQEPERIKRLQDNAAYLRTGLRSIGFTIDEHPTPIIPLMVGASDRAAAWAQRLFDKGLFITAIRPPAVPEGTARLRLTALATHTREHLDAALNIIKETAHGYIR